MFDLFQRVGQKDPNRVVYDEPVDSLAELYHEASKINEQNSPSLSRHIGEILQRDFYLKLISRPYKTYPTSNSTALPHSFEGTPLSASLKELVLKRRSIRKFTGNPISLNALANIIFHAYGVTAKTTFKPGIDQKVRSVPSGGALFPLELYVAAHNVRDLAPGVYHYGVEAHSLEMVREGQFNAQLGRALFFEDMFRNVSATFVITGVLKRSFIKYGERAYRFMMLEAGHVGQNICLSAFALDLGCLMLGGFYDDDVDEIIGIDGVSETSLYTAAIGTADL
jgi:SagB-type dehydrogenase family enzyme